MSQAYYRVKNLITPDEVREEFEAGLADDESFVAEALSNNYLPTDFTGHWIVESDEEPVLPLEFLGVGNLAQYIGGRLYGSPVDVYQDASGALWIDGDEAF